MIPFLATSQDGRHRLGATFDLSISHAVTNDKSLGYRARQRLSGSYRHGLIVEIVICFTFSSEIRIALFKLLIHVWSVAQLSLPLLAQLCTVHRYCGHRVQGGEVLQPDMINGRPLLHPI